MSRPPKGEDFRGAPAPPPLMPNREACPRPHKKLFADKQDAKRAIRRSRGLRRELLEPYRCRCGHWHIGNRRPTTLEEAT